MNQSRGNGDRNVNRHTRAPNLRFLRLMRQRGCGFFRRPVPYGPEGQHDPDDSRKRDSRKVSHKV